MVAKSSIREPEPVPDRMKLMNMVHATAERVDVAANLWFSLIVQVVSTLEIETHVKQYLDSVETGEEFIIARDQKPVARLTPVAQLPVQPRPKVGQTISPPFEVSEAALLPLTEGELKEWGL